MFYSKEQADIKIKELTEQGFSYVHCDDPDKALKGFSFENDEVVQWGTFGEEFVPQVETVDVDQLYCFVKENPDVVSSDCMLSLKVGFVKYDIANKTSIIKRASVISLRNSTKGKFISDFRDKLRDNK